LEATGAFSAIMGSLTILVDNMEDLSRYAAGIRRARTLNASLRRAGSAARPGNEEISIVEGDRLHSDGVTLQTPNYERTLKGTHLGRPVTAGKKAAQIRKLHRAGVSKAEIARRLENGRTSVRRILADL
jgi:ABC-type uncharacterized transport system fused permease/ATPase subunit